MVPEFPPPQSAPLRLFHRNDRGAAALLFALCVPALVIAAGVAVDFVELNRKKSSLQVIADAAAIAGARESMLADADSQQISAAATSFAESNLAKLGEAGNDVTVAVELAEENTSVRVTLERTWQPYLLGMLDLADATLNAAATAKLVSAGKICVIGMQETLVAAVHLDDSARLTANACGVYANSTSSWSLRVDANASLTADWICTVGGYGGAQSSAIVPQPTTDCPAVPNPLSDRLPPIDLGCDFLATVVVTDANLAPGTYCGGLVITGNITVTLDAGTYIIKGGPLLVQGGAEMTGIDVGFFLADELALFEFLPDTTIDLEAPRSGPLAGLLFFENPENSILATPRVHIITSNNARKLLGTFYLPRSILQVDATAPVADLSAYTAIVALRLWLKDGPELVLNSDYASTLVPVPKGLLGNRIVLAE